MMLRKKTEVKNYSERGEKSERRERKILSNYSRRERERDLSNVVYQVIWIGTCLRLQSVASIMLVS